MIDYFEYPGVPGRYFRCEAMRASLAETRCASMYRDAKRLPASACSSLEKCIGCEIGAMHAGDKDVQRKTAVVGSLTCARCREHASRLVVGGICVSCYNRQREVEKGRNAKGVPPRPVDRFWLDEVPRCKVVITHQSMLLFSANGTTRLVTGKVADQLELMMCSMRNVRDKFLFAFPPAVRSPLAFPACSGTRAVGSIIDMRRQAPPPSMRFHFRGRAFPAKSSAFWKQLDLWHG